MAAAKTGNGGPGLAMLAVAMLLLTLVGAGSGFAVGALLAGKAAAPAIAAPAPPGDKQAGTEGAKAGAPLPAPAADAPPDADSTVVAMKPIITNLAAPQGVWLRLEASLVTRKEDAADPALLAEETAGAILAYLRTLSLPEIEGASGFLAFRDDLDDLARTLSKGRVNKVLVRSLVVE